MILIIKYDNGEQYEDYHHWIGHVIDIETNKTEDELMAEWKLHFTQSMKTKGININSYYISVILYPDGLSLKEKNSAKYKMHQNILDRELKKQKNSFYTYLKNKYKVIDIEYKEVHDYYNKSQI